MKMCTHAARGVRPDQTLGSAPSHRIRACPPAPRRCSGERAQESASTRTLHRRHHLAQRPRRCRTWGCPISRPHSERQSRQGPLPAHNVKQRAPLVALVMPSTNCLRTGVGELSARQPCRAHLPQQAQSVVTPPASVRAAGRYAQHLALPHEAGRSVQRHMSLHATSARIRGGPTRMRRKRAWFTTSHGPSESTTPQMPVPVLRTGGANNATRAQPHSSIPGG